MTDSPDGTVDDSLALIAAYSAAIADSDSASANALHTEDYVLDLVHRDAFGSLPISDSRTEAFWPSWFASFPELDYQVTRTIASEAVVVTQWVFRGTNTGPLTAPIFESSMEATGRTIQFRGCSIYDIVQGLIQKETMYIDLGSVLVELGVMI